MTNMLSKTQFGRKVFLKNGVMIDLSPMKIPFWIPLLMLIVFGGCIILMPLPLKFVVLIILIILM